MSPRIAKISGDIRQSPWRSLLVVLAVLVGTAAMTAGLSARSVLEREMAAGYAAAQPAAAILTFDRVDDALVAAVRKIPGVADADARRVTYARAQVGPGDWRPVRLFGISDPQDVRVSTFRHLSGAVAPGIGEILVERSALPVLRVREGDSLRVRAPGGLMVDLRVVGLVHDPAQAPGWQDNIGYAYLSPATLEMLGQGAFLDQLLITVDGDRSEAARVAAAVAESMRTSGPTLMQIELTTREHPHAEHMRGSLLLIAAFGAVALVLSGALTANVFSGLLARQTRQIGVMKALGARSGQIFRLYGGLVAALAGPGALLGMILGLIGARALCGYSATELNLELQSLAVPASALGLMAVFALATPAIAAIIPIRHAVRITPQAALTDVGITPPRALPTQWTLGDRRRTMALRNSLRRPVRLALTIATLSLGGITLMTGANLHGSLIRALDETLSHRSDSLELRFLRPVPTATLEPRIASISGVRVVESWGNLLASIEMPHAADGARLGTERYGVLAPPDGTSLLKTPMIEGHWPTRAGEVAVNQAILAREPTLRVGAEAALLAGANRARVRVVGLVSESAEPHLYAARAVYDSLVGRPGMAGGVRVVTEPGAETRVAAAIEEIVVDLGSLPVFSETQAGYRAIMVDHYAPLLALLLLAAAAAIVVGGFALAATAGMNVLERALEIGVMRAIGGRRSAILGILLTEGALTVVASVVLATLLSLPLTAAVGSLLGSHSLHTTLPFVVEPWGVATWVIAAVMITLLACTAPALSALRQPVREVLTYG